MPSLTLNGDPREVAATTVAALLDELGLAGVPVLVERNGTALFPRDFGTTPVAAGDRLEIIRVVAGG